MTSYINTHVQGSTAVIELDRPKALNSLDQDMINAIDEATAEWKDDDSISQIIIRTTSPRAFCAGGDVRVIAENDAKGDHAGGDSFFKTEYALNNKLAEYPKPIVSVLEGVTMGGGFGISAHGSHRIVTTKSLGAMPEAAIGFVPDVGMTYRLTHLETPSGDFAATGIDATALGVFLGTTGWRMSAADMMAIGLATHFVEDVDGFAEAVKTSSLGDALDEFAVDPSEAFSEGSRIAANVDLINQVFSGETWTEIATRLSARSGDDDQEKAFIADVTKALDHANPTSLVAIVETFRASAQTDLKTALDNEYTVGAALRRMPNFPEGIRAVLVDKDQNADFDPTDASEVNPQHWRDMVKK